MCRLLVDAMVWNYVAKARALAGFLASLEPPVTLVEVVNQLKPALGRWPELNEVVLATEHGGIETTELSEEEEEQRVRLLAARPGLGPVDCGLLAVAALRQWRLLTCEKALTKVAADAGIALADFGALLDEAVEAGFLSAGDRSWILAYSNGHIGHRSG